MEEAMDVYLFSKDTNNSIEKSLELTNRALELDDQNIAALTHKTTLLFRKKDIDGLLQTVDELINLRPEKPYYLVQKAFYLEVKGDSSGANRYYHSAQRKYRRHLEIDSLDFNSLLEYVGLLEVTGDTTSAGEMLTKMESMNFDDSEKQILSVYRSQVHSRQSYTKEVLMKYWTGEISYDMVLNFPE
jgi:tetratricopeptide (TPR) repeat protein